MRFGWIRPGRQLGRQHRRHVAVGSAKIQAHILVEVPQGCGLRAAAARNGPGADGIDYPTLARRPDGEVIAQKPLVVPSPPYVAARIARRIVEIHARQAAIDHQHRSSPPERILGLGKGG